MNPEPSIPMHSQATEFRHESGRFPFLNWSAIIGGTVIAIAIHLFLSALGIGAGLAIFTPVTDSNPAANFSMGAIAVWTVCALVALWFGGLLAGRFSHSLHGGFVHGVLVWSLTLITTLVLVSMGTGIILGGALKVLGMGGQAVASGAGQIVKEGIKRADTQIGSFIDESVQSAPAGATPGAATRAKREIGFAVTRLFAPGNDVTSPDNRRAAIKALTDYAGMSETDATKTIDAWTTSYNNLKAELDGIKAKADQKAREVAEQAASNLSCAAIWSFFALLAGLLVAAFGGSFGAKRALLHSSAAR